jgi:hypothetical protein
VIHIFLLFQINGHLQAWDLASFSSTYPVSGGPRGAGVVPCLSTGVGVLQITTCCSYLCSTSSDLADIEV